MYSGQLLVPIFLLFHHISKDTVDSASPKFIVTLDGIPSPLGNLEDCDMELDDVRPPIKITEAIVQANRGPKLSVLQRLQGVVTLSDGEYITLVS